MGKLYFTPIGLLLFLYGMHILRSGLSSMWNNKSENVLKKLIDTPWKGLLAGTAATVLLQSSSAVTVITIGLIDSGFIAWPLGLGIVLGTNIGTCATTQLLSFSVNQYWFLFIILGIVIRLLNRSRKLGKVLMGFGILLGAMELIIWSSAAINQGQWFKHSISFSNSLIASALITAIIQSSSAFLAMVMALSSTGVLELREALPLILGANLGTCVTALIASIGGSTGAKKIAYSHILLNFIGIIAFLPLLPGFIILIEATSDSLPRQIANAHTMYNIICSLAALPGVNFMANLLSRLPPIDKKITLI